MNEAMTIATAPFSFPVNDSKFVVDGRWMFASEYEDEQSNVFKEIDFRDVVFVISSCREEELYDKGGIERELRRLKRSSYMLLGASAFEGLWINWIKDEKNSVLERLFGEREITFMAFFGDILLDPTNKPCILALWRFVRDDIVIWRRAVYWLSLSWSYEHVVAILPH